jgi:hypothetical protein
MGRTAVSLSLCALSAFSPVLSPGHASASGEASPATLVAPGDARRIEPISGRCPTFHWGALSGATKLEVAVYAWGEDSIDGAAVEVVRRWTLPGSATGYTPPLATCLDRGHAYAWTLRPHYESGPSGWAEPKLFAIAAAPSEQEIAAALEVLEALGVLEEEAARGRLDHEDVTDAERAEAAATRALSASTAASELDPELDLPAASRGGVPKKSAAAITAGNPNAHLKVSGEVRTIDPDDPTGPSRLWGNGRVEQIYGTLFNLPGTGDIEIPCYHDGVHYGLSRQVVDWGSAAAACPAGTWVCKADEITACNTVRPDHPFWDHLDCDGGTVSVAEEDHRGWLADEASVPSDLTLGTYRPESGAVSNAPTCKSYPVWCCWN